MSRTGFRIKDEFSGSSIPNHLLKLSKAERIHALRSRMDSIAPAVSQEAEFTAKKLGKEDVLEVPSAVKGLFPEGGLPRKAVTLSGDQPLLAVELLAYVTAHGGYAAVVGCQNLAYAPVIESGGVCENIIVVPDPGEKPLNTVATLCEGLDLVLYYGPRRCLIATQTRPLLAKLRKSQAALIMVGPTIPSPALVIESEITDFIGISLGQGRIRGIELSVKVAAKSHGFRRSTIVIGQSHQQWSPPRLQVV